MRVSVTDSGDGLSSEPFSGALEAALHATGPAADPGLEAACTLARELGGALEVTSRPGKGSTLAFYLPAATTPTLAPAPPAGRVLQGGGTLLAVDDEEMVLRAHARLLRRLGYKVRLAQSGAEAVEIYQRLSQEVDLVLLDMLLSGIGGEETFRRLKYIDPQVRVLLTCGYRLDEEDAASAFPGCQGFIQKPFDEFELASKLRAILALDTPPDN